MEYIVDTLERFEDKFKKFGKPEKKKIIAFINAFQSGGFNAINHYKISHYKVRNKSSIDVPRDDPHFFSKVSFAKKHKLWHFHAGFYDFDCDLEGYVISPKGDLTSQWIIHYQLHSPQHITIVDISAHPPLVLPSVEP